MLRIVMRTALMLSGFAIASLPASAVAQGAWQQVTGIGGIPAKNIDRIGLERTPDGVLHVAWTREQGASEQLLHSTIAAGGGAVSGPSTIFTTSGGGLNSSVDLVPAPGGGLRVFFSGLVAGQPFDGVMATATAPAAGDPWSAPAAASDSSAPNASPVYAASGIGAGVTSAGNPISIWGDSSPSGGGLHLGIDPATTDVPLASDCCQTDPNVAVDAVSGATVAAWSQLGPPDGLQVLAISPAGPVQTAPDSAAVGTGQRVAVSGRIGAPGIFAAYGSGTNQFDATPALWPLGAAQPMKVKGEQGQHTVLAPAPAGRLWMAWDRDSDTLGVLRTNQAATTLGAVVTAKPPPGTSAVHALAADASTGQLDLLALVQTSQGLGYWHRTVLPGLTLKAKPKKVEPGEKVKLTVTDAGVPVSGAKVKLKQPGKDPKGTTKSSGKVKLGVSNKADNGRYKATAKKAGYSKAKKRVRVKG